MKICSVVINSRKDPDFSITKKHLAELSQNPVLIRIDEKLRDVLQIGGPCQAEIQYVPEEDLYLAADLLIVFGGDGSIIKAAGRLCGNAAPIVGVNLGRVGYLADMEPQETSYYKKLLSGSYRTEARILLKGEIVRNDGTTETFPDALNDVVLSNGTLSKLIDVSVSCDGTPLFNCHGDGVIIATPTGSTAYSMSAGGPIITPTMECFCITPICSHTLSSRPIILSAQSTVCIENHTRDDRQIYLSVDGLENYELDAGDLVRIRKSENVVRLIRLHDDGFFNTLHKKLTD